MSCLLAFTGPLTDGVAAVRLPSTGAGDVDAVRGYIDDRQLDGCWLPCLPHVPAEQMVLGWLDAWAGLASSDGPVAVVTLAQEARLICIVGFGDRGQGVAEMTYGIAPCWREQGLASRAARLSARWAASQPGVRTVELRIGQEHPASQHVAANAGSWQPGG